MGILQSVSDLVRLNRHFYHWTRQQIVHYQEKAVLFLLQLVRQDSPFYSEFYAGQTIRNLDDFSQLPTINKTVMMEQFDRLNTAGLHLDDVMAYALEKEMNHDYLGYFQDQFVAGLSSGTSGNKGIYLTDRSMTRRLPGVFLARGGVSLADLPLRILFILRVFSQGFADINAPLIKLSYLSSMTEAEEIIRTFNDMKANILMAPPSLLRQLLPVCDKLKTPPRRVITYAEVLEIEEKTRISKAFAAPVVEIYQASEGQIGSPCRCGNLHINEDLVYVELFEQDGITRVTEPGQRGRVVLTNLVNTVQPLLRYEMNDIIELGSDCPCGSRFRVINRIIGRNDDVLHLMTRKGTLRPVYPDLVSRWIITTDDRIREFSVKQDAADHLTITLDIGAAGLQDTVGDMIVNHLTTRLTQELAVFDVDCRFTVRLQTIHLPADAGKMKRFIRTYDIAENRRPTQL
jgi:putative adenylate-forming enzyme